MSRRKNNNTLYVGHFISNSDIISKRFLSDYFLHSLESRISPIEGLQNMPTSKRRLLMLFAIFATALKTAKSQAAAPESSVTDPNDVVNGDIIQFKYSVNYAGSGYFSPVVPIFINLSSSGKIVDTHSEIFSNRMVYYIKVKAQPPEVPQYVLQMSQITAPVISKKYQVLYGPETSNMKITGDNAGLIRYSGLIQCVVPANPLPSYTWLEEKTNYSVVNESTIYIFRSGIYICTAKNVIRNRTYSSSKSIYIEVLRANISKGPENVVALVGSDVKLECASIGSSTLLSWSLSNGPTDANQTVIADSCRVKPEFASRHYVIAGSNDSGVCNLLIKNVSLNDTGVYTCSEHNLTSFSSVVSIVDVQQTVTKNDEVVIGDILIFHYTVKLKEDAYRWMTVQASSFPNQKCLRSRYENVITTTYSYEIPAKREGVPSFEFMINLSASVNNLSDFATNNLSFFYQNISTGYIVSYKPEEKNMTIKGDTHGFVIYGGILECHVSSYPSSNYTWQDHTSGNATNVSYGETIRVTRSGKYTCNASNVIRSQIQWCSKSIEVKVVSTEPEEKSDANMPWFIVILTVIIFGFVTVLFIYLVHQRHQNPDSLQNDTKTCPSKVEKKNDEPLPNVEHRALIENDIYDAYEDFDSNQPNEPPEVIYLGLLGENSPAIDQSAQNQDRNSAEETNTSA